MRPGVAGCACWWCAKEVAREFGILDAAMLAGEVKATANFLCWCQLAPQTNGGKNVHPALPSPPPHRRSTNLQQSAAVVAGGSDAQVRICAAKISAGSAMNTRRMTNTRVIDPSHLLLHQEVARAEVARQEESAVVPQRGRVRCMATACPSPPPAAAAYPARGKKGRREGGARKHRVTTGA